MIEEEEEEEEEEEMTGFLVIALLLCLLKDGAYKATAWDDADFFSNCPPSWCSQHGPEIRYPFRLESSNTSSLCGTPCMKLGCYGDDTILVLPTAVTQYKVTAIDYRRGTLTLALRVDDSSPSCKQKLMSMSLSASIINCEDPDPCSLLCRNGYATIVSCLREFIPSNMAANFISGPISCLSSTSQFSYLVAGYASMSVLPLDCKVVPDSNFLMMDAPNDDPTFKELAETILNFSGTRTIYWYFEEGFGGAPYNCTQCEQGGRHCGFSPHRNQTFCINHGSQEESIAAEPEATEKVPQEEPAQEVQAEEDGVDELQECPDHRPSSFERDGQMYYRYCINCLYLAMGDN